MNQYVQQFLSVILDKTSEEFFKFYHNFPSPQAKRNYIIPRKYFNAVSTLLLGWYNFATSANVKSTSNFTTLTNVEKTLWIWPGAKSWKIKLELTAMKYFQVSNKNRFKLITLNSKFWLLFQDLVHFIAHFNRNIEKNICEPANIIETWKCCIVGTTFK